MQRLTGYIVCAAMGIIVAASAPAAEESTNPLPADLTPYFVVPPQWEGDLGDFRSLLEFEDGRPVRTDADWHQRRRELRQLWQNWMGAWPPVIEHPQVEIREHIRREAIDQYRIGFLLAEGYPTEAYLLIPPGTGPRPAVLVVYYEPETAIGQGGEHRDFAWQLAKRGFVTLSVGNPQATQDKTYAIYLPHRESAQIQPLSGLAYGAANAFHVLATRPEVDPRRVGVVGHSFGGKWAMFAACLYDKFACGAWSDPGIVFDESIAGVNYWEPWYLGYQVGPWRTRGLITPDNPRTGLYRQLVAEHRDLHELHAMMAPRPMLVSGGSADPPRRWQALNHSIAVNRLLGYENRVGMTSRPDHAPNPESNEVIYRFFEHFLDVGN